MNAGLTQPFTAIVTNAINPAVVWAVSPPGSGTISASGLYTAPASVTGSQTATVTVSSVEYPTKSASAAVTLMPPVSVTVTPGSAALYGGQTKQFAAAVGNTNNTAVTWTVNPAGAGSISAAGLYTAPASVSTQQTVSVIAASQADPSKTGASTITLTPPVTVTVVSSETTLYGGQTQPFSATVTNTANAGVTWSVSPSGAGSITAAGVYTAPAVVPTQQTVTITAASVADPTKSGTLTVTLVPLAVSVAPLTVTLYSGQTQQFTPTITSGSDSRVIWSVTPAGAGSISAAGLYTAPASISAPQTLTVTATSQADGTKSAAATVKLAAVTVVSVTPRTVTLTPAQTQVFTASVTNAGNTAVTWTLSPAGAGTISAAGLYTAPTCLSGSQTVSVIATSVADPTQSVSATVTLQYANGYSYQRAIVIDHTKIPNTDLNNFPFLISGTFPYLANAANGGKVQNASGYDIIFTPDAGGTNKLDHEIESYNPATGQFTAWVRIPVLSHTQDTILYLAYRNASVSARACIICRMALPCPAPIPRGTAIT